MSLAFAPCLEKAVTQVKPVVDIQWEQTNSFATEQWLRPALRTLDELGNLQDNWDGHGSPRINASAITKVRQLFSSIKTGDLPTPAVMPASGGGVGVHWRIGKREMELTIYPDAEVVYLIASEGDERSIQDGNLTEHYPDELKRLTKWLAAI